MSEAPLGSRGFHARLFAAAGSFMVVIVLGLMVQHQGLFKHEGLVAAVAYDSGTGLWTVTATSSAYNLALSAPGTASGVSVQSGNSLNLTWSSQNAGSSGMIISSGEGHSCALRSDNSIACWGDNTNGQINPPSGTNYAAVDTGDTHSCALKTDGSIICWGNNAFGQTTSPAGNNFAAIGVGDNHSCALKTDGSLACWGPNGSNQATPPSGTNFAAIAAGYQHTCAVKTDGSLACWGSNGSGRSTPPAGTNFLAVSLGDDFSCALKTNGSLACWGSNTYGQATPPSGNTFVSISSGNNFACALKTDGSLACWGRNNVGQSTPPSGTGFTALSTGDSFACATKTDGSIACWESGFYSKTLPPSDYFATIRLVNFGNAACGLRLDYSIRCWGSAASGYTASPAGSDFASLSTEGFLNTCALRNNGSAVCWGDAVVQPPAITFTKVAGGVGFGCGVTATSSLACWGNNQYGQTVPPAGNNYVSVSVGYTHACALKTDNTLACWGRNNIGQATPPSGTFSAVSAGYTHTCGLRTTGALACWGWNSSNQSTPPAGTNYVAVSAAQTQSCALKTDGSLACWGAGFPIMPGMPAGIPTESYFTSFQVGQSAGCGIKTDNTLRCWGSGTAPTYPSGNYFKNEVSGCSVYKTDSLGTVKIATGNNNPSGFSTGPLTETTIFMLSCKMSDGTTQSTDPLTVTIGPALPTVSITSVTNAAEPSTNGSFTFTLSSAPTSNVTVNYTVNGTATAASDYTTLSGSAVVLASQTVSTPISVPVLNDLIFEGNETVVINVTASGNYIGTPSATVSITDNETSASLPSGAFTSCTGPADSSCNLGVVPSRARAGGSVTVSWYVAGLVTGPLGSNSCTLVSSPSGFSQSWNQIGSAWTGSALATISGQTALTLTCTSPDSTATKNVTKTIGLVPESREI